MWLIYRGLPGLANLFAWGSAFLYLGYAIGALNSIGPSYPFVIPHMSQQVPPSRMTAPSPIYTDSAIVDKLDIPRSDGLFASFMISDGPI